jgi:hypothetical protein
MTDRELEELGKHTKVEDLARDLRRNLDEDPTRGD